MSPFAPTRAEPVRPCRCVGVRGRRFTRRTLSPWGGIRNHSNGEMTPPERSVRSVRGQHHRGMGTTASDATHERPATSRGGREAPSLMWACATLARR
jgi:hypothetical protein